MENHITQEQISALVDRQLAAREVIDVQGHLTQCDACRDLYEDLSEVTHLFRNAATLEPPPFLWQRISAEISPAPAPASRNWLAWLSFGRPVWAAAGASLVLLGVLVFTVEFRSLQLARQETLNQIEAIRLAMNGPNPETNNPFRDLLAADQSPNPFSVKRLSLESNPFQSMAAR